MFISFEGVEGTGKSTVASAIVTRLRDLNQEVVHTREPGGTEVAESIRQVLLKHYPNEIIDNKVELLLMFASRIQHVESKIKPALKNNSWVVCERFIDASYAYQGAGRKISEDIIASLHKWSIEDFMPKKTFLLDLEPRIAFDRVAGRNNGKDRIEQESIDFFDRVRQKYLTMAKSEPDRFLVIDSSMPLEQVIETIWHEVKVWI